MEGQGIPSHPLRVHPRPAPIPTPPPSYAAPSQPATNHSRGRSRRYLTRTRRYTHALTPVPLEALRHVLTWWRGAHMEDADCRDTCRARSSRATAGAKHANWVLASDSRVYVWRAGSPHPMQRVPHIGILFHILS
uniref:Uncharacterized protein n=1 Tax=Hordeum vulgare subsp. vulgare TaxID=112509 RepID=A0A8I7B6Y7_HORVV